MAYGEQGLERREDRRVLLSRCIKDVDSQILIGYAADPGGVRPSR
jgi:hypothetical protein